MFLGGRKDSGEEVGELGGKRARRRRELCVLEGRRGAMEIVLQRYFGVVFEERLKLNKTSALSGIHRVQSAPTCLVCLTLILIPTQEHLAE